MSGIVFPYGSGDFHHCHVLCSCGAHFVWVNDCFLGVGDDLRLQTECQCGDIGSSRAVVVSAGDIFIEGQKWQTSTRHHP